MGFRVLLTDDAVRDLEDIRDYIDGRDSPAPADYVLDRIEEAFRGLAEYPHRGSCSTSGFGSTGRSSSSPAASSTGRSGRRSAM